MKLTQDDLFSYLIIGVISLIYGLYVVIRFRSVKSAVDSPILMGHGLFEADLIPATTAKTSGFTYRTIVNAKGRMMFMVDLGYNSNLHVVAYGDKSKLDRELRSLIASKWLEPVVLEGDFPEYFHLYCSPNRQTELLQMFSPDTMAEFIDFCRAYDFEIAHETLYISQAGDADDQNDTTDMLDDAFKFVKDNKYLLEHLQMNPVIRY